MFFVFFVFVCQFIFIGVGFLYVVSMGEGLFVLLLYQILCFWDEFCDVLFLLVQCYCFIVIDMFGFGDFCKLLMVEYSIECWVSLVLEVMDQLGICKVVVFGYYIGVVMVMEIVVLVFEWVVVLVLFFCFYNDELWCSVYVGKCIVDDVEVCIDGVYLQELWQCCQFFYLEVDIDLFMCFMVDVFKVGLMVLYGYIVVCNYFMENCIGLVCVFMLVLWVGCDLYVVFYSECIVQVIVGSQLLMLDDGMVFMLDQMLDFFVVVVMDFLQCSC